MLQANNIVVTMCGFPQNVLLVSKTLNQAFDFQVFYAPSRLCGAEYVGVDRLHPIAAQQKDHCCPPPLSPLLYFSMEIALSIMMHGTGSTK